MIYKKPEPGKEKETVVRLSRVGFEKISGCLQGGFQSWKNSGEETDMIINAEPDELMMDLPFGENPVVPDVRKPQNLQKDILMGLSIFL